MLLLISPGFEFGWCWCNIVFADFGGFGVIYSGMVCIWFGFPGDLQCGFGFVGLGICFPGFWFRFVDFGVGSCGRAAWMLGCILVWLPGGFGLGSVLVVCLWLPVPLGVSSCLGCYCLTSWVFLSCVGLV